MVVGARDKIKARRDRSFAGQRGFDWKVGWPRKATLGRWHLHTEVQEVRDRTGRTSPGAHSRQQKQHMWRS